MAVQQRLWQGTLNGTARQHWRQLSTTMVHYQDGRGGATSTPVDGALARATRGEKE